MSVGVHVRDVCVHVHDMYVCMYMTCMCACMCACTCVYVHVCVHVCGSVIKVVLISLSHCFEHLPICLVFAHPFCISQCFERVLFIWSMRHPASGYVQGINDLVTPFFVVFLSYYICELSIQEPWLRIPRSITVSR